MATKTKPKPKTAAVPATTKRRTPAKVTPTKRRRARRNPPGGEIGGVLIGGAAAAGVVYAAGKFLPASIPSIAVTAGVGAIGYMLTRKPKTKAIGNAMMAVTAAALVMSFLPSSNPPRRIRQNPAPSLVDRGSSIEQRRALGLTL